MRKTVQFEFIMKNQCTTAMHYTVEHRRVTMFGPSTIAGHPAVTVWADGATLNASQRQRSRWGGVARDGAGPGASPAGRRAYSASCGPALRTLSAVAWAMVAKVSISAEALAAV